MKSLPSRPPAKLFTIFPPKARFAYVDAWLNLSLREKATVFVIVRTRAIATTTNSISDPLSDPWCTRGGMKNSPTKLSQITLLSRIIARMANPTQSAGAAYRLNQKNRLSVAAIVRVLGSDDSNTQCESPVATLTSFHQRRPTKRRPAMFLR